MLTVLVVVSTVWAQAHPTSPAIDANCLSPRWSLDGKQLAYEVNHHDTKTIDLLIYDVARGDVRTVLPNAHSSAMTAGFMGAQATHVAHELTWLPSGHFAYSASPDGIDLDLFFDSGASLAPAPGADGGPAWSPDGKSLVFTSARTGQGDLYLLDASTGTLRQLTTMADSSEVDATWSPDGKVIAFVAHDDHGDRLFIIDDLEHPVPRAAVTLTGSQTRPRFSSKGVLAFYANATEPARFDLYVADPQGARPVAESVFMDASGPSWTPDGRSIVFVRNDDATYNPVLRVDVADPATARRITTGTVGNGDLDLVLGVDGQVWVALSAQGLSDDGRRDFKRIYVFALPQ